jgi:predicted pyridoxine 5'-phosphate oxidase superfamily flavin-nucleotide-binding protein
LLLSPFPLKFGILDPESPMDDSTVVGPSTVSNETALRGLYQQPMELAVLKQLDRLDGHCRNFLAHSPFAVIGSTRAGRGTDVSPRGDAPGFARVLDDRTIAIPDRPGTTASTLCQIS